MNQYDPTMGINSQRILARTTTNTQQNGPAEGDFIVHKKTCKDNMSLCNNSVIGTGFNSEYVTSFETEYECNTYIQTGTPKIQMSFFGREGEDFTQMPDVFLSKNMKNDYMSNSNLSKDNLCFYQPEEKTQVCYKVIV